MSAARRPRALAALLLAGLAARADAVPVRLVTPGSLFVRARAAEIEGDAQDASAGFATLLAQEPTNKLIAERAYRQAVVAGDEPLAVKAARTLEKQGNLPPDGRLLLVLEAITHRQWPAARAGADALQQDRLFGFLAPMLKAWIAQGAHQGDPQVELAAARTMPLAQPYLAEQRALLMIAAGQVEQGLTALRGGNIAAIERQPTTMRLLLADALAATGQRARALALIDGDEPSLVAGRALIAAGKRLPGRLDGAPVGIASLLVHVASDLARQRLAPVGLMLARYATFVAPQSASGWLLTGQLLGEVHKAPLALAALTHVADDDPLAPIARSLRIALLADQGQREAALKEALAAVKSADATAAGWTRVGDVYLALNRPREAADAYAKALALAVAAKAPADAVWPILIQQGGALDQAGDWPAARTALERAYALAPSQPLVLNQLGYSQIAHREDVTQASALIAQASKLRPDDPAITDSLGWSHYLLGRAADAVPVLERAATGAPAESAINEHLGDVYWTVGRRFEARYAWRAALVTADDKDRARITAKLAAGLTPATAAP